MRTNTITKPEPIRTAGGSGNVAVRITSEAALRRSVLSCLLWEDAFYENGSTIKDRINVLAREVPVETLAALAVEARTEQNLRHVPLLLLAILATRAKGTLVADAIATVISRADEMGEFLAIYANVVGIKTSELKKKMTHAMRRGLRRAFLKFDEHQLAKYDRKVAIKLRDVYFLVHPKPDSEERRAMWGRLITGTLKKPNTWESSAARGIDAKTTFTRLLTEGKLGYMALLKNLRQMEEAGVDHKLIGDAIVARKGADRVLPFRYLSAARAAPRFEKQIDKALIETLSGIEKLPGKTVLVVDVSGSMHARLSGKSDLNRLDAAAALAALVVGVCEDVVVYATAGNDSRYVHDTRLIPARPGMAMVDAINKALHTQGLGGIFFVQCMNHVAMAEGVADRVIVITDEQDTDRGTDKNPANANAFGDRNYLLNVSVEKNGIGYKPKWTHIDGWSENVIRYIAAIEKN